MDRHTRCCEHLGDIGVGTEEIVKDRPGSLLYLHAQNGLEISGIDLDVARMLRVKDRAVENCSLVVSSVIMLQFRLYLALLQFLFEESGELRQFGVVGQLRHIDVRKIEFVGHHECLLLLYVCLRDNSPDEEVLGRNCAGITLSVLSTLSILSIRIALTSPCLLFVLRQDLNPHAVGLDVIAVHLDGCGADGEGTCRARHQHVCVGLLKGRGAFAVDERSAAARTGVRSGEHIEIRELRRPQIAAALVDGVG